jgi:hypothetical protein
MANQSTIFAQCRMAALGRNQLFGARRRMAAPVKVFGCRPFAEACRRAETGPAFENLQGRKPRVGRAPIRRTRYGDLRVASVCWRVVAMTIKDDFEG